MKSTNNKTIYLGKEGKLFGPYSEDQLDSMKTSGEYSQYSWLWEDRADGWLPINPPPMPPSDPTENYELKPKPQKQMQSPPSRELPAAVARLQAICHDNQSIISGSPTRLTRDTIFLASSDFASSLPPFGKGSRVWLNLLDEASGKTENVQAVIHGMARRNGGWEYEMKWDRAPDMIGKA